jgi:hypothetical protein
MNIGDRILFNGVRMSLEVQRHKRQKVDEKIEALEKRRGEILFSFQKRFPFVWRVSHPKDTTYDEDIPAPVQYFTTEEGAKRQVVGGSIVERVMSDVHITLDNLWDLDVENHSDLFPHVWD